uniref:(California timema) hypothetical protein n=1 Tax=Timema californicum TaxID=61474 RepID=A0A7R9IXL2_TIMCA|nr:unnamed protein product [Timema californicum]
MIQRRAFKIFIIGCPAWGFPRVFQLATQRKAFRILQLEPNSGVFSTHRSLIKNTTIGSHGGAFLEYYNWRPTWGFPRLLHMVVHEAEGRLKQLEEERLQLDRELNAARDKITISERSKEVLEARLRVMEPQVREPDRVRRALSFMPSTKERPASLQTRYNSLRRTSDDK